MNENMMPPNSMANALGDERELQPDEGAINLPDVKDIPGQEHIHPPHLHEFADTTVSSADEEGYDLFAGEEEQNDSNVSEEEKKLLGRTEDSMSTDEDRDVFNAQLDNTDDEGDPLNENIDTTGRDIDMPSNSDEEEEDKAGEEDEENDTYSLGGDDHE